MSGAGRNAGALLAIWVGLLLLHASLLRLPYYWDEAGYFVPAALDCFRHGWLIPHSTLANGHPPLLSCYLALAWLVGGFHPLVTRVSMLLWAAALSLGAYRLARRRLPPYGAALAACLLALAPLVFAQASLAQLDLPVAALVVWALVCFPERLAPCALLLAAACLTKETAVIVPLALLPFACLRVQLATGNWQLATSFKPMAWLLLPPVALALWFGFYHAHTGFWLGNPQYYAYNVGQASFSPLRIGLALLRRIWELAFYNGTGGLTALAFLAVWRRHGSRPAHPPFPRAWWAVITAYVAFHAVVGGAVLARYLLPALALYFIWLTEQILTLPRAPWLATACATLLVVSWFWNPPYPFPYEDNLAWTQFVRLHQAAARQLEAHPPASPIWTAWPGSEELTRPEIGYVTHPLPVHAIEDFSAASLTGLSNPPTSLYLYSREYQPAFNWAAGWPRLQSFEDRIFSSNEQLPADVWLRRLGLMTTFHAAARGQWVTLARR